MKESELAHFNEIMENVFSHMTLTERIENRFDCILRENDLLYECKIKFQTAYVPSGNYYRIKILPAVKEFDSQAYFEHNFAKGKGREKLDKFKKENNVGAVVY
jgi:hypothetical protein